VVVDCGAIPPTLIESELFGHEKGAFTGAAGLRRGVFEAAAGGTVFLDEIGELPLEMQPKLLRALEDRVVRRVGGNDSIRLDVRVIAATNRDLRQEVNRGRFRTDLLYRLNTVRLRVPPLRERRDDIGVLAGALLDPVRQRPPRRAAGRAADRLAAPRLAGQRARAALGGRARGAPRRSVDLGRDLDHDRGRRAERAGAAAPAVDFDDGASFRVAKERAVASWERGYVRELVRRHDGNLSRGRARRAHGSQSPARALAPPRRDRSTDD
jgi:MoxR-like ATPase